jgi:phosphoribosylglycinamide formyltransferase-1
VAGCTVHFVTAELDHGPIVSQGVVSLLPDDTPDSVAARVLQLEHQLYPDAVRRFVADELHIVAGKVASPAQPAGSLMAPAP